MQYFVTGATGFIGKRLVKRLLERKGAVVHFLIREESADKVADLRSFWGLGPARAVPVFGDLTAKKLGVAADDVKKLKGEIDHFFGRTSVSDIVTALEASDATVERALVDGGLLAPLPITATLAKDVVIIYFPLNCGGRLARNALTPSR